MGPCFRYASAGASGLFTRLVGASPTRLGLKHDHITETHVVANLVAKAGARHVSGRSCGDFSVCLMSGGQLQQPSHGLGMDRVDENHTISIRSSHRILVWLFLAYVPACGGYTRFLGEASLDPQRNVCYDFEGVSVLRFFLPNRDFGPRIRRRTPLSSTSCYSSVCAHAERHPFRDCHNTTAFIYCGLTSSKLFRLTLPIRIAGLRRSSLHGSCIGDGGFGEIDGGSLHRQSDVRDTLDTCVRWRHRALVCGYGEGGKFCVPSMVLVIMFSLSNVNPSVVDNKESVLSGIAASKCQTGHRSTGLVSRSTRLIFASIFVVRFYVEFTTA